MMIKLHLRGLCLLVVIAAPAVPAFGVGATWRTDAVDDIFNRGLNWDPQVTPWHNAYVATFPAASTFTDLRLKSEAIVDRLEFPTTGFNPFTIDTNGNYLSFYGAGLTSADAAGGFHLVAGPFQELGRTNVFFRNGASAGRSRLTVDSAINFSNSSSGGSAQFTIRGQGAVGFSGQSTAAGARFVLDRANATTTGLEFRGSADAGTASVDVSRGRVVFTEGASAAAGSFRIGDGSTVRFAENSHLGHGSFVVAGGGSLAVSGFANGVNGAILLEPGGSATFDYFANAGNAIATLSAGAVLQFRDSASGGNARVIAEPGALIDLRELATAGTTLGSIEGAGGTIELGNKTVTVGLNDRDAEFAGTIHAPAGGVVKAGEGRLNLAGPRGLQLGSLTINDGVVALTPELSETTRVGALTIAPGAAFDLGPNDLIVDYAGATPIDAIRTYLNSGHAGGAWTGEGLRGSAADSTGRGIGYAESAELFDLFPAMFSGTTVDDDSVLVRITRYGDANLDGTVNLADFNRLAANFGQSGKFWHHGDFNYDGTINLADFNRLAINFGLSAAGPEVTPQDWANLATVVPEPASVVLVSLLGAMPDRRRTRRS